jgi:hypothetical protein
MDIQAKCGCGAALTITPKDFARRDAYGGDYNSDQKVREAIAASFDKWVQAHSGCVRRELDPFDPHMFRAPTDASTT